MNREVYRRVRRAPRRLIGCEKDVELVIAETDKGWMVPLFQGVLGFFTDSVGSKCREGGRPD